MPESILTFFQSVEPKRDTYGFAVRPQHIQTYRHYVNIYKKEEKERLNIWKVFFDQLARHIEPSLFEEDDGKTSQVGDTKLKRKAPADAETKETLHAGPAKVNEEVAYEVQYKEAFQSNAIKVIEEVVSLHESKETSRTEATELNEEVSLERNREGDTPSAKPDSVGSPESETEEPFSAYSTESEKEVQLAEETRACNVERWVKTRPAICVIENMMGSRVKKRKNMENMNMNESRDHLPSIKETNFSNGESDDEFEEKVCVNEIPTGEESNAGNEASQEPPFPWKEELESLVLGGVPKDLRGEIWQAFVGVKARRVEGYYEDLLAQENYDDDQHSNSSSVFKRWRKQIEKVIRSRILLFNPLNNLDLPRTFPGHPSLNDNGRDSLRRLLLAYARHNPSVGYCQAMNFFAGLLLLMMPEENAFWTLVGIIDDYFNGYYTEEMIESQVDQLVFEELMRERFPKLASHLDYLGVQVTWLSAPWLFSIFINILPWESVLRIWDVILFEGNRVMLFRTALALIELYGPALVTTKDAGDAITLLQSLTGSTFDSSQLVLTSCMGFLSVTNAKLYELSEKYRPDVLLIVEERTKIARQVWKDSKGLASKLYNFKHDHESLMEERKSAKDSVDEDASKLEPRSLYLDELLSSLNADSEVDSLPDLQERVGWMKVELFRLLEETRAAVLRLVYSTILAEELETALVELVKEDNRRELSAKIEELEQKVADLHQGLADKKEQEAAVHKVLMQLEKEQLITEDARKHTEQDAAEERNAVIVLQEKYEKAMASIALMEDRVAIAESILEATMQSEPGLTKVPSPLQTQLDSARRKVEGLLSFGLKWRDKSKGKSEESTEGKSNLNTQDKENPSHG